ncbi:MAG: HAMP domain-containing histidine kinase [Acetatifactor sp.]|nr:HAMP domain-containing histidine kinase [Acetatifactor sp.]
MTACAMTESKNRRKGSIFRKLIASYIIFSFFAVLIVLGVVVAAAVLASGIGEKSGFPGVSAGENGEMLNMESVQNLGGWVEELDENYRVKNIYGEKLTDRIQYTPEILLEWTDQRTGNSDFHLYWQKKEGGLYLIFYPIEAYSVTFNFDAGSMFHFAPAVGRLARILLIFLLLTDVLLVSLYISRKIHRPLQNLVMGMKRVAQGEERVELSMQTEKEFVEIQEAFNHMTEELYAQKAENEKMSKNRQKMLLELSHDIKTPVATIKSYAFALQEGIVSETELDKYYRTIALKADRVDTMAADLFTMLKMESTDYALELKKTDLAELTRRICAEFYEELTEAGFDFVIGIPEHAIYVNADEKLLSRVVSNLLNNAGKYNRTGKRIEIRLEERGEDVHLWVKDDGKPIEPELQDTMFSAFVRGESTRSTKGGTGLGLAIAKAVMEKHGGDIFYQEEEGNKFEIRIAKLKID